jgi:hypothetical protein
MSIISAKDLAIAILALIFGGAPLFMSVLVMHFLMPQAVLERYWKPPHFRQEEIAIFSDTMLAPMRTIMFLWLFLFPRAGAKRQIENISRFAPAWYRIAAIVIDVWVLVSAFGIFGVGSCLYIYWKVNGMI